MFNTKEELGTDQFNASPATRIYVREIMEITDNDKNGPPKRRRPNQLPSLNRATPARFNSSDTKTEVIDTFGSGYLETSASITDLKEVRLFYRIYSSFLYVACTSKCRTKNYLYISCFY